MVEINSDASDLELTLNITGTNFVGNPGNPVSMIANNAKNQSNHKMNVVIINSILSNNLFQTSGKECIFFVNMNQNDLNLTIQESSSFVYDDFCSAHLDQCKLHNALW